MRRVVETKMMSENLNRSPRPQHQASKQRSPKRSIRGSLQVPEVKHTRQVSSALSSVSSEGQGPKERGRNRSPKKKTKKERSPSNRVPQKSDSVCLSDDDEEINKTGSNMQVHKTDAKEEIKQEEENSNKNMEGTVTPTEEKDKAEEIEEMRCKSSPDENPEDQEKILLKNDNEEDFDQTDGSSVSLEI